MTVQINGTTGITTPTIDLTTPLAVADGGTGVSAIPAFSAYLPTANQSVTSGVLTKVALSAEEFDTASAFDTTTYRFTPQVAGYYQVNGAATLLAASGMSDAQIAIYKNGSVAKSGGRALPVASAAATMTVHALVYLNGTTDYVELFALSVGTTPTIGFGASSTYFQATLVRAT